MSTGVERNEHSSVTVALRSGRELEEALERSMRMRLLVEVQSIIEVRINSLSQE